MNSLNSKPKILCYAPYNSWTLHGMWETTILHGLKLRGADVKYVMCDGLYSECDVFWKSTKPRNQFSCLECMAHCANFAKDMRFPYEWLGRYIELSELKKAEEWSKSLRPDELATAEYEGWNIGEWVRSSVHSNFRQSYLDLHDSDIARTYRGYVYSGAVALFALKNLIEFYKPDIFFMFNGRLSNIKIALEICQRKSIRYITHERGRIIESLQIIENDISLSKKHFLQRNKDWSDIPLDQIELNQITTLMNNRRQGKDMEWKSYSPPPQNIEEIKTKLGTNTYSQIWVLFTSSDDEVIAFPDWLGVYKTQLDWIKATIEYAALHKDVNLIIRVHPNTAGKKATGNNTQQLDALKLLDLSRAPNIKMIMPESSISSYTLMDIADLGLIYMSTVGLEMACLGKPVIMAAPSIIEGMPGVPTLQSTDEYFQLLDKFYSGQYSYDPVKLRQYGHRWAYSHFYRSSIPFPLVRMPDIHTGSLNYNDLSSLLPGRDIFLDKICRVFLEQEPVNLPPGPEEFNRTDTIEKELFNKNITLILQNDSYTRHIDN